MLRLKYLFFTIGYIFDCPKYYQSSGILALLKLKHKILFQKSTKFCVYCFSNSI